MQKNIVLLGAGHTHAHVLKMWRMNRIAGQRLVCISDASVATYSGMLPGTLAGIYSRSDMEIDLVRLCASVGAVLIRDAVTGLDREARELQFADRTPLPFSLLSIGVGSRPDLSRIEVEDSTGVAAKPMRTFIDRLEARLSEIPVEARGGHLRVAVVGGGVAGLEILFCLGQRLSRQGYSQVEFAVFDRGTGPGAGLSARAQRAVDSLLREKQVTYLGGESVVRVGRGEVETESGKRFQADVAILVTTATAPAILHELGLTQDERGFLLTDSTLQSLSLPGVFAVGDCGSVENCAFPKSGVYAVRQGPVLWQNLQNAAAGKPLLSFHPQPGFLKLLNVGDGSAIVSYRGFGFRSWLGWNWKDWLDRKFMANYQEYAPPQEMGETEGKNSETVTAMRCVGCGGKVAGDVLQRVLKSLDNPPHADVPIGINESEDIAWLNVADGDGVAATVDFFTPPVDDTYLGGRLAALNAMSDLWAKGIEPAALLAHVILPVGKSELQEALLRELLGGAVAELRKAGANLAGGHTLEGEKVVIGFSALGVGNRQAVWGQSGLKQGDALVLTKPIGTGVLLMGHAEAATRAEWYEKMMESMLTSNQRAMQLAKRYAPSGCTDVTGFGLAGHLAALLRASGKRAMLAVDQIPTLPGARELWERGMQSTLAPSNQRLMERVVFTGQRQGDLQTMFDPQTSGGLLIGMSPDDAATFVAELNAAQHVTAAIIGEVLPEG